MFYVYEWYDIDTGVIFYVGKGVNKRYAQKTMRNELFKEYYSNHRCGSRIVKEFVDEDAAFAFEHALICDLKAKNQCFCNLDNGGKGGVNFVWTDEMRQYKSTHNPMKAEKQRQRMSENNPMKDLTVAQRVAKKKSRAVIIKGMWFESTKSAGEYFGLRSTNITAWCKRGYDRDKEPCRYANENQKQFTIKTPNGRGVYIDDMYFDSVKGAAQHFGVWSETIIRAIKENRKFKGHTCKYDDQQPSQGNFDSSTLEGSTTNG